MRKGDLLFTIDTRPFDANLKQAQANLSRSMALKKQAEANLAREIAREKWGLAQVERYGVLVEQGVVAREQYGQLRADYDSLKANSEAARAAVRSADETIKLWDVATCTCLRTLRAEGPYAGMNITGMTGISPAQTAALKALGAVEALT